MQKRHFQTTAFSLEVVVNNSKGNAGKYSREKKEICDLNYHWQLFGCKVPPLSLSVISFVISIL